MNFYVEEWLKKNNIEYEKSNFNVVLDGGDVRRKCIGTRQAFRD